MNKITLYHAEWCGHCKHFMKDWENIKAELKNINFEADEYEDGKNPQKIAEENIRSFPTIKITVNGETTIYSGARTKSAILNEIKQISAKKQEGGKTKKTKKGSKKAKKTSNKKRQAGGKVNQSLNEIDYYKEYLKYKLKYLKLKNKLTN